MSDMVCDWQRFEGAFKLSFEKEASHTHTHAPKQIRHLVEEASTISQTRGLHDRTHIERRKDVDLCHTLKSGCSHAFSTYVSLAYTEGVSDMSKATILPTTGGYAKQRRCGSLGYEFIGVEHGRKDLC